MFIINNMTIIFECKTTQVGPIKTTIDCLNSLLTDVNFKFTPHYLDDNNVDSEYESDSEDCDSDDSVNEESENEESSKSLENTKLSSEKKNKKVGGVIIKEVNKTSSILVHCKLDADKFDYYYYNYKKSKLVIGVNLANILKCLKCMSNFDTMTWTIDDEDMAKLMITLESNEKNEKKIFKLHLMDLEDEKYEVDPVEFPYGFHFPSQDFHNYCKNMFQATDKMEIKGTNNRVFFSGKGNLGEFSFDMGPSMGGLSIDVNTEDNEIVQGLFELKYLIIFTKCTNLCNQVSLFLKDDYPLIVQYSVAALGQIKLVLSPSKPKNSY